MMANCKCIKSDDGKLKETRRGMILSAQCNALWSHVGGTRREIHWGWKNGLPLPPLSLTLDPTAVDPAELSALLAATAQNCLLFPELPPPPVDPRKLRRALRRSTVVVSIHAFDSASIPGWVDYYCKYAKGEWEQPGRKLVAFGRASSDRALTASIHDVVVAPSVQRLGLGRQILQRLVRLFFEACGFGPDMLGSTTMLYTSSAEHADDKECTKQFGRKHLIVPSPLKPLSSPIKGS